MFKREHVHAGGIGLSKSPEDVYSNPDIGFPCGHIYVVKDNSKFPYNFVCYADNSKYISGTTQVYTKGIEFLQKKERRVKTNRVQYGKFVGEL